MKELIFLLCHSAHSFLECCLQIFNTVWAFEPVVAANRYKFVLDIYLLSSQAGANESHPSRLAVRLSRRAMHIYADSWKVTQFVTSPHKPVQNSRPFLLSLVLAGKWTEFGGTIDISILLQYWTHFSWQ